MHLTFFLGEYPITAQATFSFLKMGIPPVKINIFHWGDSHYEICFLKRRMDCKRGFPPKKAKCIRPIVQLTFIVYFGGMRNSKHYMVELN